jgi:isopentenyl diphosphate isomerase/L-lactate dehydrogenase-like FMN-dependent dehydrogenase
MAATDPLNMYDFEALARSGMDPAAYDYFAGGAGDELTIAENCRAFQRLTLRPRVLVNVSVVDPSTRLLGRRLSFPVILAPVALNRLGHPEVEVGAGPAARAAGTAPTASSCRTTVTHHCLRFAWGAPPRRS